MLRLVAILLSVNFLRPTVQGTCVGLSLCNTIVKRAPLIMATSPFHAPNNEYDQIIHYYVPSLMPRRHIKLSKMDI